MNNNTLVDTNWLAENLNNQNICVVESNEDQLLYHTGHIPGAVEIDWAKDLNQQVSRDYLDSKAFSTLMSKLGISRETTVVMYGDKSNWWACYAFWVFKLFGHPDVRILNGGRLKWEQEGRTLTKEKTTRETSSYLVVERDDYSDRAFREDVLEHYKKAGMMIDVRSPEEYRGERLHMPDYPNEGAIRGGHIPGAKNIPWATAVNTKDGTFKSVEELKAIYFNQAEINPNVETIVYCRIGERSSHTWFVLKYLLNASNVRNYDGSWTEWGNLVGVPVANPSKQ